MENIGTERRSGGYLREVMEKLPFFDGYTGPELPALQFTLTIARLLSNDFGLRAACSSTIWAERAIETQDTA